MSDTIIEPGRTLTKALVHPTTGNILLPAGTVLTQPYIDRLARQGLEQFLIECLSAPDPAEGAGRPVVKDLDAFEIEIPDLPNILMEFLPQAASATATATVSQAAPGVTPARAPDWVPTGAPSAAERPQAQAPVPNVVPVPARAAQAPAEPVQRYYHNPAHLIPERAVYGAMQAIQAAEAQFRAGQMPGEEGVRRVVDEVLDRLAAKAQDLHNGIELRIANQPHHKAHPVNVMVLSVVMGMGLGYDRDQLRTLAVGALFHDVGKTAIAPEILNKRGALTPQDVELLRAHTLIGKRICDKLAWANPTIGTIVYQHHERMNGSGYPLRLQGAQILEMSRVVAIAEVYDSLMSDTEWRPRYSPELAYNAIKGGEKDGFDPNVIRAFVRSVFPYPLHSFVVLEDQAIGQVVQVSRTNPTRPMLKIGTATVDMASTPERRIVSSHFQAFY